MVRIDPPESGSQDRLPNPDRWSGGKKEKSAGGIAALVGIVVLVAAVVLISEWLPSLSTKAPVDLPIAVPTAPSVNTDIATTTPTVAVQVTEEALAGAVGSALAAAKVPVANLSVHITEDVISLEGLLTKPLTATATIEILPTLDDGTLSLNLQQVTVGSVTAPAVVRNWLSEVLRTDQEAFKNVFGGLVTINRIELQNGVLVLIGQLGSDSKNQSDGI